MQINMLIRFLMSSMILVLLFGAGCAAPTADQETGLQLTQLQYSESSLTATVERDESRVTILIRRGGPRVEGFIRDPEIDSPFESDLAVRNRRGDFFLQSFGGDRAIDSEIAAETMKPALDVNQAEQMEDLQLAADAAKMLRDHPEVGEPFRWELRSIRYMAEGALERATEARDGRMPLEPTTETEDGPSAVNPAPVSDERAEGPPLRSSDDELGTVRAPLSTTYIHVIGIRWANCCWGWGQHSSALLDIYSSTWTFLNSVSTKNHGREASDPTMSASSGCPKSWSGRLNYMPTLQPFAVSDTFGDGDAGGCSTSYDAIPPTTGGHVCNDDSLVQYWYVKNNGGASYPTCADSTLRSTAPACD